jgi:hypothetical protein
MTNAEEKWFPCPVCLRPLDVRITKRKKPYVICSVCGVQMFIRERAGIEAFGHLVERGLKDDVLARLARLEQRYRLKCPKCSKSFWLKPELTITNRITGGVTGYCCPENNCDGTVHAETPPPRSETSAIKNEQKTPSDLARGLGRLVR